MSTPTTNERIAHLLRDELALTQVEMDEHFSHLRRASLPASETQKP